MFEQYCRTDRGNQTLQNRSVKLNSRQRALLLIIESKPTTNLCKQQLKQLATADNLAALLEHQLIMPIEVSAQSTQDIVELPVPVPVPVPVPFLLPSSEIIAKAINKPVADTVAAKELCQQYQTVSSDLHSAAMAHGMPHYLEFEAVKQLMIVGLQTYCGLLASTLIREIEQANSIAKLRLCQMRWVTTLTESRATHKQIAAWVAQINDSLDNLLDSSVNLLEAVPA